MTRTEQAAFRRIDNRRQGLFSALCVIKAWISIPFEDETDTDRLYRIMEFVTKKIEEERAAQRKEEQRHD